MICQYMRRITLLISRAAFCVGCISLVRECRNIAIVATSLKKVHLASLSDMMGFNHKIHPDKGERNADQVYPESHSTGFKI